jgi:hypothetical protein
VNTGRDPGLGYRRQWLFNDVQIRYERIQTAREGSDYAVNNFRFKSGLGRKRALRGLQQSFRECEFCFVDNSVPVVIWAYLKPGNAAAWAADDASDRDRQRCLRVFFLLVDRNGLHTGLWSIEFTNHCILRLLDDDRSPLGMTAVEAMLAAHRNLLGASATALLSSLDDFLVQAGDGVFRCSAVIGEMEHGSQMFCRADSWLHSSQLRRDQQPSPPATEPEDRLGSELLLPRPLRARDAEAIA